MESNMFTPTIWHTNKTEQIITIQVPADTRWDPQLAQHLMTALFALPSTVTLRIGATVQHIVWQIVAPVSSAKALTKTLYALYPNAQIQVETKYGYEFGRDTILAPVRYEFKLGEPFVAPLSYATDFSAIDPLTSLVGAMTNLQENETIVYELTLVPAPTEYYKLGEKLVTASRIGAWNYLFPEGIALAMFLRFNNLHRGPKYTPAVQRVLESKLSTLLKEATMNLRFYGATSRRVDSLVNLFLPPLATFAREGFNYLVPAHKEAFPLVLSASETAALWHLPTEDCQVAGIQWAPRRNSPLPHVMANPQRGILLGENIYQSKKQRVVLPYADRVTHAMLIGKTRTGKSSLLYNMARQDIAAGKGVGIIDPHGDLAELILATAIPQTRVNDVVYFDTTDPDYSMGFNPLWAPPGIPKHVMAGLTVAVIRKLFEDQWSMTRMEDALYAALAVLLTMPSPAIQDVPRLFHNDEFRQKALANVTDPVVLEFWLNDFKFASSGIKREIARPISNRLRRFYRAKNIRQIICQSQSLDFRPILDNRKIFIADLSGLSDIESETLGALIVSKIQMAAMSRGNIPVEKRVPFYFYIDEVQNFITTSLDKLFSEAGKYGINMVVANQFLKQLTGDTLDAVLGNVGTTVMFRLGPQDAHALTPFVRPRFSSEDLLSLDRFNTIVSMQYGKQSIPAFNMTTMPPKKPDANAYEQFTRISLLSRQQYARPNTDIDDEFEKRYQTNQPDNLQSDNDEDENYLD